MPALKLRLLPSPDGAAVDLSLHGRGKCLGAVELPSPDGAAVDLSLHGRG